MKYRNTRTGVTVEVNSVIGGEWEPAETPKTSEKRKTQKPAETKVKK